MNSITLTRTIDASPGSVREAINDIEPFVKASGFDEVSVEDDIIRVANGVGIATIELTLELVADPDAVLAYEQREGIFEEMRTAYTVEPTADGSAVTATTEFELGVAGIGDVLDTTVIERQRRKELTAQFDWLEKTC